MDMSSLIKLNDNKGEES